MGAIFNVSLARIDDVAALPGERIALVAHAGEPLRELPATAPLTLLVGAEREGLPEEVLAACERVAHIPIAGDSLNAAMAATIALYEMTRVPPSMTERIAQLSAAAQSEIRAASKPRRAGGAARALPRAQGRAAADLARSARSTQ